MKKIAYLMIACLALATSCQSRTEKTSENNTPTTSDSLQIALANQDSLLVLINDVAEGMNKIKQLENILASTSNLTAESQNRRKQISNDMLAIQQTLQMRRERLAELEKKLQTSSANNAALKKTIQSLKQQISDQESSIENLRKELSNANIHIEKLSANVDSLSTKVANVAAAKEIAEQEANELTTELNTCYYAFGSKSELKEHKLIETGFLRKTKILSGNFEQSYFTTADKRTLTTLEFHSKKAKVLTNQPADSYTMEEAPNGNKFIRITNPDRFWSVSNFLIVQVD